MKYIILILSSLFSITACRTFYVAATPDDAFFLVPPTIQHWQQQDNIGNTNPEQRWEDFQECGVKKYFDGKLDLNVIYGGMAAKDTTKRAMNIKMCMKEKNYIYLEDRDCVDYDKEKLTGLCN